MKLINLQKKLRLYKMFEADIWGDQMMDFKDNKIGRYLFNKLKSKLIRFYKAKRRYIYRIDIIERSVKVRRRNWKYLTYKRARLFYWFFNYKMLKKIDNKARRKRQHNLAFFILYLECKASIIIYRLFFVLSIFEVKKFIERKLFLINKKPAKLLTTKVWFYDLLQVSTKLKEKQIRFNLKTRIKKGAIYTKNPRYIYMNYGLFYGFIYKMPKIRDLAFPKNCLDYFRPKGYGGFLNLKKPHLWFDLYRGTDYS